MNVGIYIYEDAEVLDFSGPFEVFSTANRFLETREQFNVFLVAESSKVVRARHNFQVMPHYDFSNHPAIDVLIVVGGIHNEELNKPTVLAWVLNQAEAAKHVASVCTGAFLLAESGFLSAQEVTTHWEDIPELSAKYPKLNVVPNVRWVEQGHIVTSGGISAGIDMSLFLVSKLTCIELAEKTAKQMEFDWQRQL